LYLGTCPKAREFVDSVFQVLDLAAEDICLLAFSALISG